MTLVHKGNFNNLERFLLKAVGIKPVVKAILEKYGRKGVEALKEATPKDSGKTAESWNYEIGEENGSLKIVWRNENVSDGYVVAVLLEYGHATKNGGYVKGTNFITPAIDIIFGQMAEDAWKEVAQNAK